MPGAGDAAGKNAQVGRAMDVDALAWTALLARWLDYARAAKSLPADADGARWRGAVEHVVSLQALRMALGDLARVPARDQPVACDLAAIQIRAAVAGLNALWHGELLPDSLRELVGDAEQALQDASPGASPSASLGAMPGTFTELVWAGDRELNMPTLGEPGGPESPGGTLLLMAPGTIALPGEPVAIFADRPVPRVANVSACAVRELAQLYRTFDEEGQWTGSFRRAVGNHVPEAMPMLVPIWAQGERVGRFELPAAEWTAIQRGAGIGMPLRSGDER